MIKIEKLSKDARVIVTRNGKAGQVFVGQLISHEDWKTVDVQSGEVTYSVNETEIKTKVASIKNVEIKETELQMESVKVVDTVSPTIAAAPKKIITRNATAKK